MKGWFMQIILTCDVVLEDKNAQNIHVIELFNNMSKVAKVSLFVPKPKKIKYKSSNIKYVPWLPFLIVGPITYQTVLFLNLYFYCKKTKVDAIYTRQSEFSFAPLIISKLFGIPYFVEVNGLITDEMKMFGKSKFSITFTKVSEKFGYQHAIKIVAVTPGVKKGIIQLYNVPEEKIVIIENGANIELFRPIDQSEAKRELNLSQDINYVCFVGNFAPWQGIEYLIQASPAISKSCPNAYFLIVGDGIMKNKWMLLAQNLGVYDRFIFTGTVPYAQVPLYINASDVCVATFLKKRLLKTGGSPLKIYEYLACKKPIVSSRIPNIEFIEQRDTGLLVEPENPDELAKAIIKLLKDEKLREKMGKNGREYVMKKHSWEAVGRTVTALCEQAVHENI
jgi:glycosyltransferase involved in cell wall biosynthesis